MEAYAGRGQIHANWELSLTSILIILLRCEPSHPLDLWNEFKTTLTDDLPRKLAHRGLVSGLTREACEDYGLFLLQMRLQRMDKTMTDIGLPSCTSDTPLIHPFHPNLEAAIEDLKGGHLERCVFILRPTIYTSITMFGQELCNQRVSFRRG
jgi:hypothetical protein